MEKSIVYGLDYYISQMPGAEETDAKSCSPLVLAYIGDCVFDLVIKTRVVGRGNRQVHKLHEETSHFVQASAQSFMMRAIQEHLTAEEHAVYRRATGFEALIGYLYLEHQYERLTRLISIGLASMESPEEAGEKRPAQDKGTGKE